METLPELIELNRLRADQTEFEWPFVEQLPDDRYYEKVVFEDQNVPLKSNWHDCFNALCWLLFPKTKTKLNQFHIEDISAHGLSPRTPRRNRITHFDECGGILVYENSDDLELLRNHCWVEAFKEKQYHWGTTLKYFIFGHANYEMLMKPFIGLTGKYLPLRVAPDFWGKSLKQQYQILDQALTGIVESMPVFDEKGHLLPIPMLGIPGYWSGEQDDSFYLNKDYFRPKRQN